MSDDFNKKSFSFPKDISRDNVRFPRGAGGVATLKRMNEAHNDGALKAINFINLDKNANLNILDIGFGGGQNFINLKNVFKNATLFGVDHSPTSLEVAKEVCAGLELDLRLGSVLSLEFGDAKFDLVTAFETLYFWDDLELAFSEVKRVLKSGGSFFIFLEGTKKETLDKWSVGVEVKNKLSVTEILEILEISGFKEVNSYQIDSSEKHCFIAKKP